MNTAAVAQFHFAGFAKVQTFFVFHTQAHGNGTPAQTRSACAVAFKDQTIDLSRPDMAEVMAGVVLRDDLEHAFGLHWADDESFK